MILSSSYRGKVILAGAGPGDPELITMKLAGYLHNADVIVTDRLVNSEIIHRYANKNAIIIHAGKKGYSTNSTPQEMINHILVQCAQKYPLTIRLKGGDTAFFSNILDELFILSGCGIQYEIVPGITAASGASACTGIPLTARNYASGVRFLTFHNAEHFTENEWMSFATTTDTLVFYMGLQNISILLKELAYRSNGHDKPVAVVQNATGVTQKIITTSLLNYNEDADLAQFESPSIIIVGEVVSLYKKFNHVNTQTYNSELNYTLND